jgi:hypothetical protein
LEHFECDDVDDMNEYVGCKIDRDKYRIKVTQPVLIQSFVDEFDRSMVQEAVTPAPAGEILTAAKPGTECSTVEQTVYRSGVGKLMHLTR